MDVISLIAPTHTILFVAFVATAPSKPFTSIDAISLFIALLAIITVCLTFAWESWCADACSWPATFHLASDQRRWVQSLR
jgi:hypothetical protein